MREICDVHSHVLPGVDDGPADLDETMSALEEAKRQHIDALIVTPHFHPGRYMVYAPQIFDALEKVRGECSRRNFDMILYPGQECYYYSGLVEQLNQKKILTLADSRYVLVEFEPDCPYSHLQFGVRELQSNGYVPVLAHFERYQCLQDQENILEMREKGVLLQMNFDALLQRDGLFHRRPWKQFVRQGLVDLLGSDCHGTAFRPYHAEAALEWLHEELPEDLVERMLYTNVQKIIHNR